LSVLALDNPDIGNTLSMLTIVAPRPADAAGIGRVCRGSLTAVRAVITVIGKPSARLLKIEFDLSALAQTIAQELHESGTQELALPMLTRKGSYQQWSVLAALAEPDMPFGACLAAGVELLRAWKDGREITKAATADMAAAINDEPLSKGALELLLNGLDQEEEITAAWHMRLRRSWRQVVLHYGEVGSTPPPANFEDRARGQILESSVFARPSLRAGAADHRQLSRLQMKDALAQIGSWIEDDDFRGAYGFMVCVTGFTIDLIPLIPLTSPMTQSEWITVIDTATGCLKMDVSVLAQEAAGASSTAATASNFVSCKPMPKNLAAHLRARLVNSPAARCLGELYPEATPLVARTRVIRCHDEIKPSWARLRHSTGTCIRQLGIDNLLVSMISGDFGHIPRSKVYYACVEPREIGEATARFYQAAGWRDPVEMPSDALAFGCRVVPSNAQIRRVDQWWLQAIHSMAPAKHCALTQVLEHHNRFMALSAYRLALLLALREQREYILCADVDERVDRWLPLDDKSVPGLSGALPVPLTKFAALSISALRAHCRALLSRLQQQGLQYSPLARWCDAVVRRQSVPLLMKAASPQRLQAVGTLDCLRPLPVGLAIAPDFGRKAMENALRLLGLRTGDIDAVLRHEVLGQSRATSVSDFNLLEWLKRVTPVMDELALELFGDVCFGLSRE
jgi:hypothetical protein